MAARDLILVGAIIMIFGIGYLGSYYTVNTIYDKVLEVPSVNQSNATVTVMRASQDLTARMDYVIFGVFIGLVLGVIVLSWFVGAHPVFMFVYFLVWVVSIVFATIYNYVWDEFASAAIFSSSVGAFPITNHIMQNIPLYMGVIGFISIIVIFAKPRFENEW